MTTIRDFSAADANHSPERTRAQTWNPRHHDRARSHRSPPPLRESPSVDRRGSVLSTFSHRNPDSDQHLRHRQLSRSTTIRTYHEGAETHHEWQQPGAEPGIDPTAEDEKVPPHLNNLKAACEISIIDFSDEDVQHVTADNETLAEVLAAPRPEGLPCRWISVNGLSWDVIKCVGNKYGLHRLAVEDLIHTHSRTKVDWYRDQAFVVLTLQKLVRLQQDDGEGGGRRRGGDDVEAQRGWWPGSGRGRGSNGAVPKHLAYLDQDGDGQIDEFVKAHSSTSEQSPIQEIRTLHRYESAQIAEHTAFMEKHSALSSEDLVVSVEQVSIFLLADNTVISFFEHSAADIQAPILDRLASTETMLRRSCDASLLLQAIIDAIVDLAMPVRDAYNKARKELQVDAMTSPDIRTSRALHIFGEEIDMLQNLIKPIVHLVNALRDHQSEPPLSATTTQELYPSQSPPDHHTPYPGHASPENQAAENCNENRKPSPLAPPSGLPGPHKLLTQTKRTREGRPLGTRSISSLPPTRSPSQQPLLRASGTTVAITPLAHTYFGDVLDHCIVLIQALEQMDASANNISTLIFNTVGAKTNSFTMILAVVTVFFAPLTVVSGYFGMNFASGAGLKHDFGFFFVVAVPFTAACMALVGVTMVWDHVADFLRGRGVKARRRVRGELGRRGKGR